MKNYFIAAAALNLCAPLLGEISDIYGNWMTDADKIRAINESNFGELASGSIEQMKEDPVFLEIKEGFLSTSTKVQTIQETFIVRVEGDVDTFNLSYIDDNGEIGDRGITIQIRSANEILLINDGNPALVFERIFPESRTPSARILSSFRTDSFQLTMLNDTVYARTVAVISWKKPDRRAMVVYDLDDGFPVMLAVDGTILFYNVVGGNILQIPAEPEAKAIRFEDMARFQIGMRGDFPHSDSSNLFEFDLGAIFNAYLESDDNDLFFIGENQSYQILSDDIFASLKLSDSGIPERFFSRFHPQGVPYYVNIKNIQTSPNLPAWHRPLEVGLFSSRLKVIPVREEWRLSEDDQKMKKLMLGGAMWVIRRSLIDPALENGLRTNSPIHLDFDRMRENDEAMKEEWLKAVEEQGLLWRQVLEQNDADNPVNSAEDPKNQPDE